MKSFKLVSKQGRQYRVSIPAPRPGLQSAYIFAFARSGSTLLNNMVAAYCRQIDVPTFSLFNTAFDQGVATQDIQEDACVCFKKSGYIYTGFRHFPAFNLDLTGVPAIWLTRDPRDMLVSLYYSELKSHPIPKGLDAYVKNREEAGKLTINQFAISRSRIFANQFRRYKKKLAGSDFKIYRYEDVIYEKEKWLTDVVTKLRLSYKPRLIGNFAEHFDIMPDVEDVNEHIRQVHPGDHRNKLTRQTIQELNKSLADFLKYFDYEH